jgi:hypothetical protein
VAFTPKPPPPAAKKAAAGASSAKKPADRVVGYDPGLGVSVTQHGKSLDARGKPSPTVEATAVLDNLATPITGVPFSRTNVGKAVLHGDLSGFKDTVAPPHGGAGQVNAGIGPFPIKAGGALDRAVSKVLGKEAPAVAPKPLTPAPTALGAPAEVTAKLAEAKKLRQKQEFLYRQERGKRAGAAADAMQAGGREGYQAALGELKGELPKLRFGGFENFDADGLDALFTHIQTIPSLRTYDKLNAQKALISVLDGKVPTRRDIKLLGNIFGEDVARNVHASVPFWAKAKHAAFETLNVPRSLMASFDLSAPFRQGLMVGVSHPRLFFSNFNHMFKAFGSENAYRAIHEDIATRPTFGQMQRGGLAITELGPLHQREEQFLSNYAEHIPVAGIGVRASGRAYTGFLDKTRADLFDLLVEKAQKSGLDTEDDTLLQSISRFVNSATGRGDLGAMQKHALALNALMFSPRLLWSRLNFMNPVYYARLDPFARKEALKAAAGLVGTVSAVLYIAKLGGAHVNTDPRNADFAKIRVGNTRIDVLGGFQQPARVIAQLTSGKIISSTTGKELTLGPQGPGKLSRRDIVQRFFEAKLSPVPSLVNDMFKGTDFNGKPFSWKKAAYQRMIPLLAQDAADLYREGGLLPAVGAYGIGAFGLGIQTYAGQDPSGLITTHGGGGKGPAGPSGEFAPKPPPAPVSSGGALRVGGTFTPKPPPGSKP